MARRMWALPAEEEKNSSRRVKKTIKRREEGLRWISRAILFCFVQCLFYQSADVQLCSLRCPEQCIPQEGYHTPVTRSSPACPHHRPDPLNTQRAKKQKEIKQLESCFISLFLKHKLQAELLIVIVIIMWGLHALYRYSSFVPQSEDQS